MKRETYTVESLCELIDEKIDPINMSPEEANEFLEALQMEIESRLEGLKDDIQQNSMGFLSRDHDGDET